MEHSKTPWKIGTPPPNGEQTIGTTDGLMVAVTTTGYGLSSEANARRIVACVNACDGLSTDLLEKAAITAGHIEARERLSFCTQKIEEERDQLMLQNAQLLAALRDVISWVPGREKWHTDEPIKAVERARAVMGATVKESLTVDHQASSGASVEQQLTTERASLLAESQRKQQMERQVEELVGVLGGFLELHDNPAPFSGKTGEERMRMLENATAKRNAAIFAARAVIQKVRGGE